MTGNWRDRAGTAFDCQKQPASGSRGMVVSNHPPASAAGALDLGWRDSGGRN
jgi:gamma-glutamyltranspeptidase/glutathione hydrolase